MTFNLLFRHQAGPITAFYEPYVLKAYVIFLPLRYLMYCDTSRASTDYYLNGVSSPLVKNCNLSSHLC